MILGIDTAAQALGVALADDAALIAYFTIRRPNVHDALLAPLVEDLLTNAGIERGQLRGVAVSAGPGSFTGLRIGMALAKGLSLALEIPMAAVPTLDAIAHAVQRSVDGMPENAVLTVLLDARRDLVYHASYRRQRETWICVQQAALRPITDVAASLDENVILAGDCAELLLHARPALHIRILPVSAAEASDIALLGERMIGEGQTADPDSCEPMYLQDFIVKQAKNALFPPSN